jgi:hypothetical protein
MAARRLCALSLGCALALGGLAGAQTATERIRGDVIKATGHKLAIRADNGRVVAVTMAENVRVRARSATDRSAIALGAFIGTTAVTVGRNRLVPPG